MYRVYEYVQIKLYIIFKLILFSDGKYNGKYKYHYYNIRIIIHSIPCTLYIYYTCNNIYRVCILHNVLCTMRNVNIYYVLRGTMTTPGL